MPNIIQFTSKNRCYTEENLAAFIRLCKDELTTFNTENYIVDWDSYSWEDIKAYEVDFFKRKWELSSIWWFC